MFCLSSSATCSPSGKTVPLVALPTDTLFQEEHAWRAASQTYIEACAFLGLQAVLVPSFFSDQALESLLNHMDGVLLTGAVANVAPQRYNSTASCGPYDEERDSISFALITKALARGLPLLGICRGLQELNVACGGTLHHNIQEHPPHFDHRAPKTSDRDKRFALAHSVKLQEGGILRRILGEEEILVNSLHEQAIDKIGCGLTIEACAKDGTIEAIAVTNAPHFALAVQWHPEYWVKTDTPSKAIFQAFAQAVEAYHQEKKKILEKEG